MERVSAEMSLHVLAYNMKRMIKIMGIGPLLAAIRAYGVALTVSLSVAMALMTRIQRSLVPIGVVHPKIRCWPALARGAGKKPKLETRGQFLHGLDPIADTRVS
jgi:hypothetical protein